MLKAEKIYKSFAGNEVLHGVDFSVEDAEFVSIMGESGSGKSTLLSILAGNMRPDSGLVTLNGRDISNLSERELSKLRRTELGFVYQSFNLIPTLRADENIMLPIYLDKGSASRGRAKMEELADILGIEGVLRSFPDKMSGGERQRVAIARALVHEPKIIMLDEPTGSLDSEATCQVLELLRRINKEMNVSIIQVTHSEDAAKYGDRIAYLSYGRMIEK